MKYSKVLLSFVDAAIDLIKQPSVIAVALISYYFQKKLLFSDLEFIPKNYMNNFEQKKPMIFRCLLFVAIISFLPSTNSIIWPSNEKLSLRMNNDKYVPVMELHSRINDQQYKLTTPPQNLHYGVTTEHRLRRPWRLRHHHRHLRTVHGIVNIFGWGILFPIGVIAARYFKQMPSNGDDWYSLHILSQISGFILGTIGWGLGMSIRSAAKEHNMSVHGILGTIIFALSTIQLITAFYLRTNHEEHESNKFWVICHQLFGYVLIILIITNVYQGIDHQNSAAANKWKWAYGVIVGALAFTFLALQLVRWIRFRVIL